jgi:electron transfer flavoprotein beta subunit
MNILVCVKRVPATGGKIALTADEQEVDTRFLGFTVSPHEECAVEEAIRIVEKHGGTVTVLTLGPDEAIEQLRDAMAMGAERAMLLESGGHEWDGGATAGAIIEAIQADGESYDLLLFGNESADAAGHQVGIRVACALDLPCVTGVKALDVAGDKVIAHRPVKGGWESFELALPAVITIKEGINLPRYPTFHGRMKAKKREIQRYSPPWPGNDLEKVRLVTPLEMGRTRVEVLGDGPEAAPEVIVVLRKLNLLG